MVAARPEHRELVPKTAEELGLRLFESPPTGFEPLKARVLELRAYGYPARPDAGLHPEAHAQWVRVLSRPLSMIRPEFAVVQGRGSLFQVAAGPLLPSPPAGLTHKVWSGAINFSDGVNFVSGQWAVPGVNPAGNGSFDFETTYSCATWVGIGGLNFGGPEGDLLSLIQAGTDQDVVVLPGELGQFHDSYVWWEWLPNPDAGYKAVNLAVSPGNVVVLSICLEETQDAASFFIANLSTGVATSFFQPNPTGQFVANNSAEWIVEDPAVNGQPEPFARYGEVLFYNCVGGTNDQELTPGSGELITMVANGTALSTPQLYTDTGVRVDYTGP